MIEGDEEAGTDGKMTFVLTAMLVFVFSVL